MNTSYSRNEKLFLEILFQTFMGEVRTKFGTADRLRIAYALEFAARCHASVDQRRKYTFEPYIVHPVEVARNVLRLDGVTVEMVIAALLHDTVEDTQMDTDQTLSRSVALAIVERLFGPIVRQYVDDLTEVATKQDGSRAQRKKLDRDHTEKACGESQSIKLADIDDNAISFMREHTSFALLWMREKVEQALICTKADPSLLVAVRSRLDRNVAELAR